jgi:uncharacterized protein YfdQ (DUF2303 family)
MSSSTESADALPESAEHLLSAPRRIRAALSFYKIESFIAYVNRFKDSGSLITGRFTEQAGRMDAILDYHDPSEGDVNGARWCQLRAAFVAEPTPEWVRWVRRSGESLSQLQFAEFLEDNSADIVVPDSDPKAPNAAQMISVAPFVSTDRYLVRVRLRIRLDRGKGSFIYQLDRPRKIIEAVVNDLCVKVKAETERDVLLRLLENVNAGIAVK